MVKTVEGSLFHRGIFHWRENSPSSHREEALLHCFLEKSIKDIYKYYVPAKSVFSYILRESFLILILSIIDLSLGGVYASSSSER